MRSPLRQKKMCRKYDGKHIGYYEDVYFVHNCQRRLIKDHDLLYKLLRKGHQVVQVDPAVIRGIPQGKPIVKLAQEKIACKKIQNRYVTIDTNEIYFIDNCKKRLFPEWDSYRLHSQKLPLLARQILFVSAQALRNIPTGKMMPSILDKHFAAHENILENEELDTLSQSDACAGLNNQFVTYYGQLYKIEKCRRREVQDQKIIRAVTKKGKLRELDSQRWVSLPEGEPIEAPKKSS